MSRAGSIASTTARRRIVGGSGIWTMIPLTAGSAFRAPDRLDHRGFGGFAVDLDEAAVDPGLLAAPEDLAEVDHRRRIPAADQDREHGSPTHSLGVRGDILAHRLADLAGDRAAQEQSGASAGHPLGPHPGSGSTGPRASPLRTPAWTVATISSMLSRIAMTRAVASPEYESSSTEGRLIRTLAAAPRAAASPRSVATSRSLEALTLLRPTSASAVADELQAGLDRAHRDVRRPTGGRRQRLLPRGPLLVGVLGPLHRGRELGVGVRVLVGEIEEPRRQPPTDGLAAVMKLRVSGVLRAPLGQGRDHRHERRPERGADRRRAATAGHRCRGRQLVDERAERQVTEGGAGGGVCHPPIVGPAEPVSGSAARRAPATAREVGEGGHGTGVPAPPSDRVRGPGPRP